MTHQKMIKFLLSIPEEERNKYLTSIPEKDREGILNDFTGEAEKILEAVAGARIAIAQAQGVTI